MYCAIGEHEINEDLQNFTCCGSQDLICEDCINSEGYKMCKIETCECVEHPEHLYNDICECCYESISKPEWMEDEEEFMDSYDPDRD